MYKKQRKIQAWMKALVFLRILVLLNKGFLFPHRVPPTKLQFLGSWGRTAGGAEATQSSHTPDDPKGVGGLDFILGEFEGRSPS